jgi:opacity protein-like surface antigen
MGRSLFTHRLAISLLFFCLLAAPRAWAQGTGAAASREQKWEVEGYGGLSLGRFLSGGKLTLPVPGAPITTSSPVFPSWQVPSWFFGDGAAFLNNVAAEFGLTNRLTPVDALLTPTGDAGDRHGLFGVRVRRHLKASYSLELGAEFVVRGSSQSTDPSNMADGVEPSLSSFTATFRELFSRSPFTAPVVSTSSSVETRSTREAVLTASVSADARPFGGVVPYGTLGAGVLLPSDGPQTRLTLTGNYRFQINGSFPFDETDRVVIDYSSKTAFVIVFGGGVRWDLSSRWGIRADGRFLSGPNPTAVQITATPASITGTPAAFIESFTYPNLQFSNNASTGRVSTLSGSGLADFDAFDGGWLTRGRLTVGAFWRF